MEPKELLFKYLQELRNLNLPEGKFAVFGSAPLAIRNMRESHDVDIIVKKDLWDVLAQKYPPQVKEQVRVIKVGNVEIYNEWADMTAKIDEIIDNAETIEGFPFAGLNYVLEWKEYVNREKDKNDIKLIKEYLSK